MKFSIVFPVYNTSPYLERALESLCAQSFRDFEVIAVNDGSTDDSALILNRYATRLDIKIFNQENRGLSAARNVGLEQASGEFVYMMDSDDSIHPRLLERVAAAMESGLDYVVFDCRFVHDGESITHEELSGEVNLVPLTNGSLTWFVDHRRGPMVVQYAFRRSALRSRRFIEGIVLEDYPFTASVHADRALTGAYLPHRLYYYYQRAGSIMHRVEWRKWISSFEKALTAMKALLSSTEYEGVVRAFYVRMFRTCWRHAAGRERTELREILERMARAGIFRFRWLPLKLRFLIWLNKISR